MANVGDILSQAITTIASLAEARVPKLERFERDGELYVFNPGKGYVRIEPVDRSARPMSVHVAGLTSLLTWAEMAAWPKGNVDGVDGIVGVSRTGTSVAYAPAFVVPGQARAEAAMLFFDYYLPAKPGKTRDFSFGEMVEWLGRLDAKLNADDRRAVESAMATIEVVDAESTTISRRGGVTTIGYKAGSRAKSADGGEIRVPEFLRARVPFGDPSFETEVMFGLEIVIANGAPRYKVRHVMADGAVDRWVEWAKGVVDAFFAERKMAGWVVLVIE